MFLDALETYNLKEALKEAKSKKKNLSSKLAKDLRESFNEIEKIKQGKKKGKTLDQFLKEV